MKFRYYLFFLFLVIISCHSEKKDINSLLISKELKQAKLFSGKILRIDSFPTKFITPRSIDIWLPENYSQSKKYAVLYMHDGQMLFDSTTTWNKQEWKIDEVATQLMQQNITRDFIVIGIHNIPEIRWLDLFPEKSLKYLNDKQISGLISLSNSKVSLNDFKGDEYLQFLVKDLKPYIDTTFSVYSNKENTFVAGSSMGGLMSMYAISEYPNIFQGAACVSTHWPGAKPKENNVLSKSILKYVEDNIPNSKNHKIYFDYGDKTLDKYYPKFSSTIDSLYFLKGYNSSNFKNIFFPGENHSEKSWQKRIHIPLTFLLNNN